MGEDFRNGLESARTEVKSLEPFLSLGDSLTGKVLTDKTKKNALETLPTDPSSLRCGQVMSSLDLEPVTPDPKKLFQTAFILVIVMIVGGVLILKAYEKRSKDAAKDDRPSFVTKISEQKDLVYLQQDGKLTELLALKGKVLVVQCLASDQEDPLTTDVMRSLKERYATNQDFALVTLMLDPGDAEGLKDQLAGLAEKLGAELPKWTVASNDRPTLHKFIKNEFKANQLPYQKDGEWKYDRSLFLIDKNRHVRKAVVPQKRGGAPYVASFDFEQAEKWDAEGIQTGTERNNVGQLQVLLEETIEILLKESIKP
jgi:cytochrome oxidase Cu insertion factor (SCO1/SenC/PrrC family)